MSPQDFDVFAGPYIRKVRISNVFQHQHLPQATVICLSGLQQPVGWPHTHAPHAPAPAPPPTVQQVIEDVRRTHPALPIILYISGSGGLLERMAACNPDIISIDQSVDITDGIKRVGSGFAIQVSC